MATCYTECIGEREDLTFEEFAWKCARAIGCFVDQREDSLDSSILLERKVDSYYYENLEQSKKRLEQAKKLVPENVSEMIEKSYQRSLQSYAESKARRESLLVRYNRMLAKAESWNPPTDKHVEFKKFMIEQIRSSIEHDCSYSMSEPTKSTPEEYIEQELEHARWSFDRSVENLQKAEAHIRESNEWTKSLVNDLGTPPMGIRR